MDMFLGYLNPSANYESLFVELLWIEVKIGIAIVTLGFCILCSRLMWSWFLTVDNADASLPHLHEVGGESAKILSFAEGKKKRDMFQHARQHFLRQAKSGGGDNDSAA